MNTSVFVSTFLAASIEVIEMVAIIVTVGVTRQWRGALAGTLAGLFVLAVLIAALAGAPVEPRVFDSDRVEQFAGLPPGRYLEQWLATAEPGITMHLPTQGVPALTYLQKDLAAGWRGRG